MRDSPTILHLDLDAFFAAVEQRDKPSLRGKPVIVGGLSGRGVVSTASYEARVFGVHSAMPMHEARRLCPHAAFLAGRFGAYRVASRQVMGILHAVSPVIEPLSFDEAFLDIAVRPAATDPGTADPTGTGPLTTGPAAPGTDPPPPAPAAPDPAALAEAIRARVRETTHGLTASVGVATSKFIAKLASELAKPDGVRIVEPGTEADLIAPLPIRALPGIGPMTEEKLHRLGIKTVTDLRDARPGELRRELGPAQAAYLSALAHAQDDRPVSAEREVKSISMEDTFEIDLRTLADLEPIALRDARLVAARLRRANLFARTITLKLKLADFTSHTRSRTLFGATDRDETIAEVTRTLLAEQTRLFPLGIRLLGVGVSGFTTVAQESLFESSPAGVDESRVDIPPAVALRGSGGLFRPGEDVIHDDYGEGWVWGSGLGLVTVRFETRETGPGPIRTLRADDPALRPNPVIVRDTAEDGQGSEDNEPSGVEWIE